MKRIPDYQLASYSSAGKGISGGRVNEEGRRRENRWLFSYPGLLHLLLLLMMMANGIRSDEVNEQLPSSSSSSSSSSAEVCQMETFEGSCEPDEVLIIRSAELGRVKLGRCIREERYDIGCHLDVMPEMDRFCSGRQQCEVKVDDNSFKRATSCHMDLKNHLWITYECIKVTIPSDQCGALRQSTGILSSFVTEVRGCGLAESPWVIQLGRGQRINVTLYDFGSGHGAGAKPISDAERYSRTCRVYATIRESGGGHSRTVCGGVERVVNVFTSTSEKVEIRILTTKIATKPNAPQIQATHFLLQYTAVGCADLDLPKNMLIKRIGEDTLTISCSQMNLNWQLTCKGNEWKGYYGNCTTENVSPAAFGIPYAVSTITIVIIAMIVSCAILAVGVLCIKRRITQEQEGHRLKTQVQDHYDGDYSLGAMPADKLASDSANTSAMLADASGNEYARMRLQRMTDYTGSPPCRFEDGQSYGGGGGGGYKYPIVEHVYESPDSLRREDLVGANPQYTARVHGQREATEGNDEQDLRLSNVHSPLRAGPQCTPTKAKNAGNYSL